MPKKKLPQTIEECNAELERTQKQLQQYENRDKMYNFQFVAQFSYLNYTIKLVNNSTATLDYMRKVRTVFCPDFLAQS